MLKIISLLFKALWFFSEDNLEPVKLSQKGQTYCTSMFSSRIASLEG